MRVNIYAEEMSEDIEIIEKKGFTGLRLFLYLPTTVQTTEGPKQVRGKFMHRPDDDDSAAVTFWGKRDLRKVLKKMLAKLDEHYGDDPVPLATREPARDNTISQAAEEALEELHPGIIRR